MGGKSGTRFPPLLLQAVFLLFLQYLQAVCGEAWVQSTNLQRWLHPFDLCLLKDARNISINDIEKDCMRMVAASGEASLPPVRCRVGNTWPSRSAYCDPRDIPFAQRSNLRNAVAGYDDPSKTPLKDFFRLLSARNGVLLLLGDSVMQQFYSAVACELEREQVWKDPSQFTNTDEVRTVALEGANGSAAIRFLPMYHLVNGRYDRVPNATMTALQTQMKTILRSHSSIVVLANMGLHYVDNPVAGFSKHDYHKQVMIVLTYLQSIAVHHPNKDIHILWRETTAQHFPTPNGYWPGVRYASGMKVGCVPIKDASAEADWRNRMVEQIVLRRNLFKVKIIPFYNITVPLWSEHPNGNLRDCTHFCWSPLLYQPIFHAMLNAIR